MTAMWMGKQGQVGDASAPLVAHAHLEPGVRLLRRYLDLLGCRMHRGCEGHAATTASPLHLRRVTVAPLAEQRRPEVRLLLQEAAAQVNSTLGPVPAVSVEFSESHEMTEIVFVPQPGLAAQDYFDRLVATYGAFCDRVADALDTGRSGAGTNGDLLSAVNRFYDNALSWHCKEPADTGPGDSVTAQALRLHAMNFGLWHHEDAVRRPGVGDREVSRRKRRIDDLNAQRNAAIEDIDATLLERVDVNHDAPLHTDTPGTIVDRLSVLALRILHTNRGANPAARLALLEEQHDDLIGGLERFLSALQGGEIRFKLYRQFKSAESRNYCALYETRDF